nr:D-alanine--D-alanine ligase family protein [Ardenticatena sp.]
MNHPRSVSDIHSVAVLFGGRSGEHDVSLLSARSVIQALTALNYHVYPIGIARDGTWLPGVHPDAMREGIVQVHLPARPERHMLDLAEALLLSEVDVVFPVLHGPYGEDGTVQGLLEMAGLPYVGCGVLASAVAMDKAMAKVLLAAAGLPQVPYLVVRRHRWRQARADVLQEIEGRFGTHRPLFVKPANLGSSVGVSRVDADDDIAAAIDLAAAYDRKVIVEYGVPNAREIEVSVLGNDEPRASVAGEIRPLGEHTFYDYVAKYTDGHSELLVPAPIDEALMNRLREMAVQAFRAIDGSGLARVDFLLDPRTGEVFLNELNTMPGFTHLSMYARLWEAEGMQYTDVVQRLLELAIERHAEKMENRVE